MALSPSSSAAATQLDGSAIPPELWDHILDFLWEDRHALVACGLVCRAWIPTTRLHLFRGVLLRVVPGYVRFKELIDTSSYIAPCVRNLTIIKYDPRQTSVDGELLLILLRLNRVEMLSITNWSGFEMSDEVEQMFGRLFPRVTTLHLENVVFGAETLPRIVHACTNLSALHLYYPAWHPPRRDPFSGIPETSEIVIQDLTLEGCPLPVFLWLLRGPLRLRLRRLDVTWKDHRVSPTIVQELLTMAGAHLEQLSLHPKNDVDVDGAAVHTDIPDLSQNTQLVSLHLRGINIDGRHVHLLHDFDLVVCALASIRSPHLTRIQLSVRLLNTFDLAVLPWSAIDTHLARLARDYPHLLVIVHVTSIIVNNVSTETAVDAVVSRLPKLWNEGTQLGIVCAGTRMADAPANVSAHLVEEHAHWFHSHAVDSGG